MNCQFVKKKRLKFIQVSTLQIFGIGSWGYKKILKILKSKKIYQAPLMLLGKTELVMPMVVFSLFLGMTFSVRKLRYWTLNVKSLALS